MLLVLLLICTLKIVAGHDRPIIGVLTQEADRLEEFFIDVKYRSYIAASYVKFVESSGGRVVPIWLGRGEEYYKDIVRKTNGLLFPGGAAQFNVSMGYRDAAILLYNAAVEKNKEGEYYPIFGTCLGMEIIMQASIDGHEIRAGCKARNVSLPLEFAEGYNTSKMFSKASEKLIQTLKTQNVTFNMHSYCFTMENFTLHGLNKQWRLLSTNKDIHGFDFISAYEHINYPFYGLQFHVEKLPFEFKPDLVIPHWADAIEVAQYFGNFFMDEARKNDQVFDDVNEEQSRLIYNYAPRYSGIVGSVFEQVYVFSNEQNVGY